MRLPSLLSYLCSLTLCVVIVSTAHAEPTKAAIKAAHAAQTEGDRLRDAGDLRGALEKYATAYATLGDPTLGLKLAKLQQSLGMLVEARQTAAEAAASAPKPKEPPAFATARADAQKLAAEIEPKLSVFGISLNPALATYTLRIDGALVDESLHGMRYRTNPGSHTIEVEAPGYKTASQSINLREGSYQLFLITLAADGAPPAAAVAAAAPQPEKPAENPTPTRAIEEPVQAPAEAVAAVAPPEPEDPPAVRHARMRGYIGLAAGGAVFATGVAAGAVSFAQTANAKDECAGEICPSRVRSKLETADTLANISNITIPLGLLGIAYGVYELVTASSNAPEEQGHLDVSVDQFGAYATYRGKL
jgi:hypothetical protein